jgi:site-specific recombinase XerD
MVAQAAIFLNFRDGQRLTSRGAQLIVKDRARRAGITTPLIHCGTASPPTCSGHGADLRSIQEMLGHASLSRSQIYTHLDMKRLREISNRAHQRA